MFSFQNSPPACEVASEVTSHFLIGLQNSPRMNLNELKSPRAVLPLAGWDAVILNFKTVN